MTGITARTDCYGLIGDPVSHSRSPEMMNAALSAMGESAVYLAWRVENSRLGQAVEGLRSLGVCGWNVTIPHKVAIMDFLDALTPEARAIGAVNTVVNRDGVLTGTNTDGTGYLHSLKEDAGVRPDGIRVVLLGAGGAARATGYALAKAGVRHMTVAARSAEKAEELARRLDSLTSVDALPLAEARRAVEAADLLVQCTPVGMHPEVDAMPIPADWIREGQTVSDLVYRPRWTRLLREAAARGARVHDGTGMLIRQAAEALRIWTGKNAPVSLMKQVLDASQ